MDHQLNQRVPRQPGHAFKSSILQDVRQAKKIIGGAVPVAQNPVAQLAQGSVENGPFPGPKRKISSNFLTAWDHITEEDIGAQMQMLVTINMRWWNPIEPLEFIRLRLIDLAEGLP